MALKKEKTLPTGHVIEYWRVIETNINYVDRTAHIAFGGYLNRAMRLGGAKPADSIAFDFSPDNFPFDLATLDTKNPLKISYIEAKKSRLDANGSETNWFVDATDAQEA